MFNIYFVVFTLYLRIFFCSVTQLWNILLCYYTFMWNLIGLDTVYDPFYYPQR